MTFVSDFYGTAAELAARNPVVPKGAVAGESDTGVIKLGDGVTRYNSLSAVLSGTYAAPGVILAGSGIDPAGIIDSTAAIQVKINSVSAGGALYVPPGIYKISAALNIPTDMSIIGSGARGVGGTTDSPAGVSGSVILQTSAATDGVSASAQRRVNIRDLAVKFADSIAGNTGHGFKFDISASSPGGGITDSLWSNLYVLGHDGNHYAYWWNCPILLTTVHLRSYGGGGFYRAQVGASALHAGNDVHIHPYCVVSNSGTAAGFADEIDSGKTLNFSVFIRPQCNMTSGSATQHRWNSALGAGSPTYQSVVQPDLEGGTAAPVFASDTHFSGRAYGLPTIDQAVRVGALALSAANTAPASVAVGYQALNTNSSGDQCTAVGYQALKANTLGSYNTAVGYQALTAQAGSGGAAALNTAVGRLAGNAVTTGYQNTLIGANVGSNGTALTTGFDNVLAGYNAGFTGGSQYSATVGIGKGATIGASNTVAVGTNASASGSGSVAIGTSASASGSGSVAIGRDSSSTAASTSTANEIALGTANHQVKISNNATGAGTAALGTNCPATTVSSPYTWLKMTSSDGSTVYVPAWK